MFILVYIICVRAQHSCPRKKKTRKGTKKNPYTQKKSAVFRKKPHFLIQKPALSFECTGFSYKNYTIASNCVKICRSSIMSNS